MFSFSPGTMGGLSLVMPWVGMAVIGVVASTPLAKGIWERTKNRRSHAPGGGPAVPGRSAAVHRQPGQRQLQSLPCISGSEGVRVMKWKKYYPVLPAVIFVVFLAVMALLLLFSPVREYSENEKRYLAGRPEVSVSGILEGETQEQLEKFTADQVPGRDFFVGGECLLEPAHRPQWGAGYLSL